ncbi:hypothetical protein GGS24DRAFT_495508 [Hypoxylon argillaceum]|nr:hypothetical protein GGS24DRAFT_495508 [Hypoxylon argillaceum]
MAGEVGLAYDPAGYPFSEKVKLDIGPTSNFVAFYDQPISLSVAGLYGCTSVIAVSNRGAWVGHMWEVPGFTHLDSDPSPPTPLEQLATFRQDVLKPLHTRTGPYNDFGLAQLRVASHGHDLPISHLMDDDIDPRVFMFVPYKRPDENTPNYNNEFPTGLPEAWGQADGLPSKNDQIQNELKAIFSIPNGYDVPIEKVLLEISLLD